MLLLTNALFKKHCNIFHLRHICCSVSVRGEKSLYDDLGLDPSATSQQIKETYYELSKKYHPDVNVDNPETLKKFQQISHAYSTLGEPKLRRQYDKGTLGRFTSVADRESAKHRFEGDDFVESRAAFKKEFGEARQQFKGQNTQLDDYVKRSSSKMFERSQNMKKFVDRDLSEHFNQAPERSRSSTSSNPNQGQSSGGRSIILVMIVIGFLIYLFS